MPSQLLASLSSASITAIQETITNFKLIYTRQLQGRQPIDDVCAALLEISERDSFELLLEAGESLRRINSLPVDVAQLNEFCSEAEDIGEINVSLSIKKNKVQGSISIYSISAFERYVDSSSLSSILSTLSIHLDQTLHFEVKDTIVSFHTQTLSFGNGEHGSGTRVADRASIISNFREVSSFIGVPDLTLVPNDFHLRSSASSGVLDRFFELVAGLLSLAYLANASELSANGKFSVRMYGYKGVIAENISKEYLLQNGPMLYKIYRWVYDTDTVADRLGLARNVISLHLDSNGLPTLSNAVWDAIHSNYQIYLRGNIESYLEVKGKLAELILESINKTNQLTENLLDSLKNNAVVIITFLLTVVVINGVKDLSASAVFSTAYLIVALFLAASSWAWLVLLRRDTVDRFAASSSTLSNVLRTNYSGVLLVDEIDRSLLPAIAENSRQLNSQIEKYSRWWKWMLGSFTILYIIGFAVFNFLITEKKMGDTHEREKHSEEQSGVQQKLSAPDLRLQQRVGPQM